VYLHRAGAPALTKVLHWPGQENNCWLCLSLNTEMKTLKSFGCSFIYGSDLSDDISKFDASKFSHLTWPALISKKLNLNYECYAQPGSGNFKIYCNILAKSYKNDGSIYLINWSWIDRFDYVDSNDYWQTLRPSELSSLEKFYYRNLHSQLADMISNASYIVSAAEHLKSLNCPYIMTYMDYNLLEPIDPNWHDPRYLEVLQEKLSKLLNNFDGRNFLDWCVKNNYQISSNWHPLENAHAAAAEYWLPAVKKLM